MMIPTAVHGQIKGMKHEDDVSGYHVSVTGRHKVNVRAEVEHRVEILFRPNVALVTGCSIVRTYETGNGTKIHVPWTVISHATHSFGNKSGLDHSQKQKEQRRAWGVYERATEVLHIHTRVSERCRDQRPELIWKCHGTQPDLEDSLSSG